MEYHEETEFLVELKIGFCKQLLFIGGIDIYAHMQSSLNEHRISTLGLCAHYTFFIYYSQMGIYTHTLAINFQNHLNGACQVTE